MYAEFSDITDFRQYLLDAQEERTVFAKEREGTEVESQG